MSLRDRFARWNSPVSLTALAAIGLLVVVIIGGFMVGYISFIDAGEAPDPNAPEPPALTDTTELPPGYGPENIAFTKASEVHRSALDGTAYTYEYRRVVEHPDGSIEKRTFALNVTTEGETRGVERVRGGDDQTARQFYSADGIEYVEHSDEQVQRFADSRFATGLKPIETILTGATLRVDEYKTDAPETYFTYEVSKSRDEAEVHGSFTVDGDGLIRLVEVIEQRPDGTAVETSVVIEPQEHLTVTRPAWVAEET